MDRLPKFVRERTNLQRIVEGHTWIFGEHYNIMGSDRALKTVLEKIREHVRDIDDPGAHVEVEPALRDVPDYYLVQQKWNDGARYYQHLIVEMKGPRVRLLPQHIDQVERYAREIVKHPIFSQADNNHRFTFVLVSAQVSQLVKDKYQEREEPGFISRPKLGHPTELWALQWSDILDNRSQELEFLRGKLEVLGDPNDLDYLRRRVGKFLPAELMRVEPDGHADSPTAASIP